MELVILNKYLKKSLVFLVLFMFVGFVVSCGNSSSSKKTSLSTDEIYTKAVKGVELPSLQKLTNDELEALIKIKSSDVSDSTVYISMMNVKATEIGIFKFNSSQQETSIDKSIDSRLKDLETTWSTYLPDQYELVKNVKKFRIGNVKGYVISEEADKIVSNIESALK